MRRLTDVIAVLIVLAGCALGWWIWTERRAGPAIEIRQPRSIIGLTSSLVMRVTAPGASLSGLEAHIEQGGRTFPAYSLEPSLSRIVEQTSADWVDVTRNIGKHAIAGLQSGRARIVVRASRSVMFGLRDIESTATREVQVDLQPPRVEVRSTGHRVSHGGAELVLFRVIPPDVQSGVRVGSRMFPGFAASLARLTADETLRVSVFALHRDDDPKTPVEVFAQDADGRRTVVPLDHQVSQGPFGDRRVILDDESLRRVVGSANAEADGTRPSAASRDLLRSFLTINRDRRQRDDGILAKFADQTIPSILWEGVFEPPSTAVGTQFGEKRTYVRNGREIDRQTYLGIDFPTDASDRTVRAAQSGVVLHAGNLGVHGNSVLLDHGLGVQSLYGRLTSIAVEWGDEVGKAQAVGQAGVAGTGGSNDHVQFMLLVSGHPVNPVEWFDPAWIRDHLQRRIDEAVATVESTR
jgi:murein DD-endopeptidase MepM/ murein hydrolase activator NlpD